MYCSFVTASNDWSYDVSDSAAQPGDATVSQKDATMTNSPAGSGSSVLEVSSKNPLDSGSSGIKQRM